MVKFDVTFDQVTEESAQDGDHSDAGFISQDSRLRDAIKDVSNPSYHQYDGATVETDSGNDFRWINVCFGMCWSGHSSGITETRALHIPERVTCSSRGRIKRLVSSFRYD